MSLESGYTFPPASDRPWGELCASKFCEGVFYVSRHGLRVEIVDADPDDFQVKFGDRNTAPAVTIKNAEVARRLWEFFADVHAYLARHEFENSREPEQDPYEYENEPPRAPRAVVRDVEDFYL